MSHTHTSQIQYCFLFYKIVASISDHNKPPASSILAGIKAKSQMVQKDVTNSMPEDVPKITADVQSSKLKQMLAGIKQKG